MKKALVAGGTGLIGKHLVELLLADERYTVIALVRKPMALKHERLIQVPFTFDNPDIQVVDGDEIFCCLGTTVKSAGSKQAFHKVDFDYVLTLAQSGFSNGVKKFGLVSSMGANKNSPIFYNKTKGAIEEAVTRIGYETLYIFRPSMLLGKREEFRFGEMIGKFLMKGFDFLVPRKYKAIQARQVAKTMVESMQSGKTGVQILESDCIRDF